jgi:hypothetical protein
VEKREDPTLSQKQQKAKAGLLDLERRRYHPQLDCGNP